MIAILSTDRYFNEGVKAIFYSLRSEFNFYQLSSGFTRSNFNRTVALIIIDIHSLNLNFEEQLTLLDRLSANHPFSEMMVIINRASQVTVNTLRRYHRDLLVVTSRDFFLYAKFRYPAMSVAPVVPVVPVVPVKNTPFPHNEQPESIERLTKREIQVLRYLSEGKCLKKIARATNLHAKTISHYKCSIMKKYGCSSMSDLKKVFEQLGYHTY